MQIGDAQVPVLSAIAGEIMTWPKAGLADEFDPRLERVAHITVKTMRVSTPIDEEHCQRAHALRLAVRCRVAEEARMGLQ